MSFIKLHSGKHYDFLRPTVDMISIHDISHNLAREQRFGNCLDQDWSVLQHVLLVSHLVKVTGGTTREQYIALHHDDPEAYLRDMATPAKELMRDYQKLYFRCAATIAEKFNIDSLTSLPDKVKKLDRQVMLIEDVLFSPVDSDWHNFTFMKFEELNAELDHEIKKGIANVKHPKYRVQQLYLKRHVELVKELDL